MPVELASFALAGALAVSPHCQWQRPGADRFTGDLVKAVDHYADLPASIRERLKAKVARHAYDDRVVITRQGIQGERQAYKAQIQDMHFGSHRVCRDVRRDKWPARRQVRALVYCEEGNCLMVPSACGNLSRVSLAPSNDPLDVNPAAGPAGQGPTGTGAYPQGRQGMAGAPPLAEAAAPPSLLQHAPAQGGVNGEPQAGAPLMATDPTPARAPPVIHAPLTPIWTVAPIGVSPFVPGIPEPPAWMLWLLGLPLIALTVGRVRFARWLSSCTSPSNHRRASRAWRWRRHSPAP